MTPCWGGVGWGGSRNRRAMLFDDSRCKRVAAIRWLAVFKRTTLGLTAREVTEHLHVTASSQKRWLSTLEKTGDVFPQKRGTCTTCAASVYSTSLLCATRIERAPGSKR
jgi:hypothetical protein